MLRANAAERLIPRLERHAEWLKRSGRKEVAIEVKAVVKGRTMNNEYPTEETLQAIREWPFENLPALFDRLKQEWWNAEWGWSQDGWKFSVSTGGWSGNEELIDALQANAMVWGLVWLSSRRGGHFEFEIPQNFRHAPKPTIAQQLAPALRDAERVAGNLAATLKPKE